MITFLLLHVALGDVTFVSNAAVYFLLSSLKASQQNQTQPEYVFIASLLLFKPL